jgi:acetylornithine deacetylase
MRVVALTASIETLHQGSVPAFLAKPGSEAVALALAITGAHATSAVSYATGAGLFEEAGCPTVICGPGDIEQAHAADESRPRSSTLARRSSPSSPSCLAESG